MSKLGKAIPFIAILAISACADQNQLVTRADSTLLTTGHTNSTSAQMLNQTAALNASANRIVRASTFKGAAIGALVGCGLTVVAASNAKNCVAGAAIGGAGGAVIGNAQGKKDVARRVEIADPNKLVRSLRRANGQMATLNTSLPQYLNQQDAELSRLDHALSNNSITPEQHARKVDVIRQDRARIAEALTLTASQAKSAVANLESAAAEGQAGLDWHIISTSKIEKNATSARSSINLL